MLEVWIKRQMLFHTNLWKSKIKDPFPFLGNYGNH